MIINTILAIILTSFCYIILPFLILLLPNKARKICAIISLIGFIIALLMGVWGKIDINRDYISFAFDFSGSWCAKSINLSFDNLSKLDIVINLLMLIPVGIFSFYAIKKYNVALRLLFVTAIGLCCGAMIELTQFVLPVPRSVQLSDVIFNGISTLIGALICWLYSIIIDKIRR